MITLSVAIPLCAAIYASFIIGPSAHVIDISVSVVDAQNWQPVPNAKVLITTRRYGIFDDSRMIFPATADDQGNLSFKQRLHYAISHMGVIAYNQELTKRGVHLRQTYASLLVDGPSKVGNRVHFYPNHGHFGIAVSEMNDAEREKFRRWYESDVRRARTDRHLLKMRGIEVSE